MTPRDDTVPVAAGQTRRDKRNGTIVIVGPALVRGWIVRYPALDGEVDSYMEETILQLYPEVIEP